MTMIEMGDQNKLPQFLIDSAQFGQVPLDALAVSHERAVSARLETVEATVKSMTWMLERLCGGVVQPQGGVAGLQWAGIAARGSDTGGRRKQTPTPGAAELREE